MKFNLLPILLILFFAIYFLPGCSSTPSRPSWIATGGSWGVELEKPKPSSQWTHKGAVFNVHPYLRNQLEYYHNVYADGKPKGAPVGLPFQYKDSDKGILRFYP